jgi:acyl-CoA dehydrogenase
LSTKGSIIVNLTYSDEQAAYAAAARHFADEVLVPISQEFDMDEHLSADEVQSIRSRIAGYEIATVPPTRSDGTLDLLNLGIFIEEVSRVNVGFGAIFQILFFPISTLTSLLTAEQREAYGYIFGSGGIASIAVSEPNAGSNPRQMETLAEATDDGWVLNGQKLWISFADIATGIVVAARVRDSKDIGMFIVPSGTPGCTVATIDMLGMRASAECEVVLNDCHIPGNARIVLPNGVQSALELLENGRLRVIFMAVGVARAALDLAVEYVKNLSQPGRPMEPSQLVLAQAMLADMATEVEAMRLLALRAASLRAAGSPDAPVALSTAKAFGAEAAVRVASTGVQIHGTVGLARGYAAERLLRDARMFTIPDGTTQIHQLMIGRHLTGISAIR